MKLKLKNYRQACGITQQELAKRIGISTPTLIKYEKNPSQCTIEIAKRWAKELKMSPDVFFCEQT